MWLVLPQTVTKALIVMSREIKFCESWPGLHVDLFWGVRDLDLGVNARVPELFAGGLWGVGGGGAKVCWEGG